MPTENDTVPTPVFPLGKALKSRKFTGTVWLQWLVEPDDTFNCPAVWLEPVSEEDYRAEPEKTG